MKNLFLFSLFVFSYSLFSQEELDFIEPDLIIGNYGINIKDKTVGTLYLYGCGADDWTGECYGYKKNEIIDLNNETLYLIGNELLFESELPTSVEHIQILNTDPTLYLLDNKTITKRLYPLDTIDQLPSKNGSMESFFFIDQTKKYYLDQYHGFSYLTDYEKVDWTNFEHIYERLFHDKKAVYFVESGYSIPYGATQKQSEIIKLADIQNGKIDYSIYESYIVINDLVYDLYDSNYKQLQLDAKKLKHKIIFDYDKMSLLYDDKNVYHSSQEHYSYDLLDCKSELDKEFIGCHLKDNESIITLRATGYSEYFLSEEKKYYTLVIMNLQN